MPNVAKQLVAVGRSAPSARRPRSPARRPAMVLILVLIVVMILALAGFGFAELMLTENKAAHLHGDELRLQSAQSSAVEFIKQFVEAPAERQLAAGGAEDNPLLFRGVALAGEDRLARKPTRQVRFSVIAPLMVDGETRGQRFGLENESGRLHLGDVLRWEQQQSGAGRKALAQLAGMTPAVADAILDWLDADETPRELGAESDYYAGLERPYSPRNGLPESIEELLLVKGVTRTLLFGSDANYNYQQDPEELLDPSQGQRARAITTASAPWATRLTLYSGQRNLNSAGRPCIDLNSADLVQLQQQLITALDANWAAFIVAYRQYGPYAGSEPGTPAAPAVVPAMPPRYTISSVLDLAGARVSPPATAPGQQPTVHASPLAEQPQAMAEHLPKLLDKLTVIPVPVTRGGVSVNHAPRDVLMAVPGMTPEAADRIVAARGNSIGSSSTGKNPRQSATWILTEGLVDLPTMRQLMPYLNAGGDVVRAQVVSHFDGRGPTARAEVVIDATTLPARQIAGRDLRIFGAAFPRELLSGEISTAEAAR